MSTDLRRATVRAQQTPKNSSTLRTAIIDAGVEVESNMTRAALKSRLNAIRNATQLPEFARS